MWIVKGRQGEGGRHVPIGAGWQRDAHAARHGGESDAVAVTLENEAGADQPTSTPLFAAPIRAW
jgi:hypothetical protein